MSEPIKVREGNKGQELWELNGDQLEEEFVGDSRVLWATEALCVQYLSLGITIVKLE